VSDEEEYDGSVLGEMLERVVRGMVEDEAWTDEMRVLVFVHDERHSARRIVGYGPEEGEHARYTHTDDVREAFSDGITHMKLFAESQGYSMMVGEVSIERIGDDSSNGGDPRSPVDLDI
jgi:hypothetical protein